MLSSSSRRFGLEGKEIFLGHSAVRLRYYTPLRYPGGKAKLASYIKALIKTNELYDGEYVEPFCGGAAIVLELLFHEYVIGVHINDISSPIYAFWNSVPNHTDGLCQLIRDRPLTVRNGISKRVSSQMQHTRPFFNWDLLLSFWNRTNRSGVLSGEIIGRRDQTGQRNLDARINSHELIFRVKSIAKLQGRIQLTGLDALQYLKARSDPVGENALIYLDLPYYSKKGRQLYCEFYGEATMS